MMDSEFFDIARKSLDVMAFRAPSACYSRLDAARRDVALSARSNGDSLQLDGRRTDMRTIKMMCAAAALALGSVPAAQAASVLASAPALGAYPTNQVIYCDIVNLYTAPKNVTIEIMDYFGNVVTSLPTSTLGPNQGTAWGDASGNGAWCRFTVDGSAKKYRAVAIYDNGTSYTVSLPAN
jgi:hypothetical protein